MDQNWFERRNMFGQ